MATADELLSKCEIEIDGIAFAENDFVFFTKVMAKLARHMTPGAKIKLILAPREPGKMLEWGAYVGLHLYLGIIQRNPGDDPEFHS